jgi:acetolactate synthase small subunit
MNVQTKVQRHNILLAVLLSAKYRDATNETMTRFISIDELESIFRSLNMTHLFYRYSVYLYDICKNETRNTVERELMIDKQYANKKMIAFRLRFADDFKIDTAEVNDEVVTFAVRNASTLLRNNAENVKIVATRKNVSNRRVFATKKIDLDSFNVALASEQADTALIELNRACNDMLDSQFAELCNELNIDLDYEMTLLDDTQFDVHTQRALAA